MAAAEFKLFVMPRANQQTRDLLQKAFSLGFRDELITTLKTSHDELRSAPEALGDPAHRTRKQGGRVYGAVVEPIYIRYAVFEHEKMVFLLDVKPLSRFFPE